MSVIRRLASFSLLWKLAIVNLIPILLLGVVLSHYLRSQVRERALHEASQAALDLSRSTVQPRLSAREALRGLKPARLPELERAFRHPEIRDDVAGITVWSRTLRVVYSRDRSEVGRRSFPVSNELRAALNGDLASRRSGGLLAVYVPLFFGSGSRPEGAVELSLPYRPIERGIRSDTSTISLLLFAGLALLYGVLFRIAAGASRTLRRQAEENEHLALHDALTDLPNRTLFHDRVRQAILGGERELSPVAVMIMDLDRFKEVNDTLGHASGDQLLKEVGLRLRDVLRASDTVARLGGDEFGILLPRVLDAAAAAWVAGKIRKALEQPFVVHGLALQIEASIGIALYPHHGADVHTLLQRADVAMYLAKGSPSGCEIYAAESDEYSPDRLTLLGELRRAIDLRQLVLHYQPKTSLRTGEVRSVEALVRWRHPQRGVVPPDAFIPLAQKTGLVGPLTLFVLEEALRQSRVWRDQGLALTVGVNLSARNLLDVQLPETVQGLLARWKVPPAGLELEITESAILADPVRAMDVLTRLSEMGVRLAIDDFGTGYSSLAYLKRLPVQAIKIDKSFVQGMESDEGDFVIVRSTIDLGRNLGLEVVAEGVESEQAWQRLAALGCDTAQGYYISRPLPAAELAGWVRRLRLESDDEPAEKAASA